MCHKPFDDMCDKMGKLDYIQYIVKFHKDLNLSTSYIFASYACPKAKVLLTKPVCKSASDPYNIDMVM